MNELIINSPDQDTYSGLTASFWNFFLTLTIKIPLIKMMQYKASLILSNHFLTELKVVQKKGMPELNTIMDLSQMHVGQIFCHYPAAFKKLKQGLKETIYSIIQKMQNHRPFEPLQIHLGGHAYKNPFERRPLTSLFIEAFSDCLQEHSIPIRFLHIYGPCESKKGLNLLLEGLKYSDSLSHLHLHLDKSDSKEVLEILGAKLKNNRSLQACVFHNYTQDSLFSVSDESWKDLGEALDSHPVLNVLSFYYLPTPPKSFETGLSGYQISSLPSSQQGFCIKKG